MQEKKHRLGPEAYQGFVRVSFTACILERKKYFISNERFKMLEVHLLRALKQYKCESEVYLFMPDHLHIIITGNDPESDAYRAMKAFKQYSGYWMSKNRQEVWWQDGFHDHILREEEDYFALMKYILNNPVRAGICETWEEYPHKGSTVFDLTKWKGGIL